VKFTVRQLLVLMGLLGVVLSAFCWVQARVAQNNAVADGQILGAAFGCLVAALPVGYIAVGLWLGPHLQWGKKDHGNAFLLATLVFFAAIWVMGWRASSVN
jgi:hypothetical protein